MTQAISSLEERIKAAALADARDEWLCSMRLNATNAIHFLAQFFGTDGTILESSSKGLLPGSLQIPDRRSLIFSKPTEGPLCGNVCVNIFALLAQMESGFVARRSAEITEAKTQSILAATR